MLASSQNLVAPPPAIEQTQVNGLFDPFSTVRIQNLFQLQELWHARWALALHHNVATASSVQQTDAAAERHSHGLNRAARRSDGRRADGECLVAQG